MWHGSFLAGSCIAGRTHTCSTVLVRRNGKRESIRHGGELSTLQTFWTYHAPLQRHVLVVRSPLRVQTELVCREQSTKRLRFGQQTAV